MATPYEIFRNARDLLFETRTDYHRAMAEFRWPQLDTFNWAFDWFDHLAAERPDDAALWIVGEDGTDSRYSFAELRDRSLQLADWLRAQGANRGEHLLLLLGNEVELWEVLLAAMRLGLVVIPATTLLGPDDLRDRVERGDVRHVVARSADAPKFDDVPGSYTRVAVGDPVTGWLRYADSFEHVGSFSPEAATRAGDPLLLYFTSGTTARPKLVEHTHVSYPVGHLSTMYWIGMQPGDVHLNVSSPGWAKHAWSNVFAPWNAGATILIHNVARFDARALLDVLVRCEVTTFCAPPTVWRMLVQQDLGHWRTGLREVVGAGEPLNPEVIEQVSRAWGLTVRDGYGQTETTAQIGNSPGQRVVLGSMGRPLPGYAIELVDPLSDEPANEGEICLDLADRPMGLMVGYRGSDQPLDATSGRWYRTGDVATRDAEGYLTYVGRADDVFKASDYRISPFELESALIEHEAVAEAAVVPAPDPVRAAIPKAYIVLAEGYEPTRETARAIFAHSRAVLAPFKRVRRIEFGELPKTISGKIRRVELRKEEEARVERGVSEFREEDFPELRA